MDEEARKVLEEYKKERGYVPQEYEKLANENPKVLTAYWQYRKALLEGALPRKFKELMLVALNIAVANEGGAEEHADAAVRMGATKEEIRETVLLTNLVCGMIGYSRGVKAIEKAEKSGK